MNLNSSTEPKLNDLTLAALFHDIGKFWQRTGEPLTEEDKRVMDSCCPRYTHLLYSARFIREIFNNKFPLVENIVLYHHLYPLPNTVSNEYRRFVKILMLADCSPRERKKRKRKR